MFRFYVISVDIIQIDLNSCNYLLLFYLLTNFYLVSDIFHRGSNLLELVIMRLQQDGKLRYKVCTYRNKHTPIVQTEAVLQFQLDKNNHIILKPNEVLIKIDAAALNGIDLLLYNSTYSLYSWFTENHGIGLDYSGQIFAIGSEIKRKLLLNVGDEVCGMFYQPFGQGTVAEYILYDGNASFGQSITKIPSNLTIEQAAAWPLIYGTAHLCIEGQELDNKKVLIIGGATSVGRYVSKLAYLAGAKEIITTNSQKSDKLVKNVGATDQIDYNKYKSILSPVLESVKNTGPFDYIYDCRGTSDLWPEISTILKPKSTKSEYVSIVGDQSYDIASAHVIGMIPQSLKWFYREITSKMGLLSVNYRYIKVVTAKKSQLQEINKVGKNLIELEHLDIYIDSIYDFNDFDLAIDKLKNQNVSGKIIIKMN